MDQELIHRVVEELRIALSGRYFGKIYQLSPVSFAIDFGLRGEFLFVSVDPASPRLYLTHRRTKDLEKQSLPLNAFGQMMRSRLSGAHFVSISKDPLDRIVRLHVPHRRCFWRLVVQLTGRTADVFLLDELNRIVAVLREQAETRMHQIYQPPPRPLKETSTTLHLNDGPPSAQLDKHFAAIDAARAFDAKAKAIRSKANQSIRQQRTLREHLHEDLVRHGDPEEHKRTGDLLLANIATAVARRQQSQITDYYAEGAPTIEIEVDENRSLQDEAAARFRQYTKAKRAAEEIAERLKQIDREITQLERRLEQLDQIIQSRDEAALDSFEKPAPAPKVQPKKSAKPSRRSAACAVIFLPMVTRFWSDAPRAITTISPFAWLSPTISGCTPAIIPVLMSSCAIPRERKFRTGQSSRQLNLRDVLARRVMIPRWWCTILNESFYQSPKARRPD